MNAPLRIKQLRQEAELSFREIPYDGHVTKNVVITTDGDYVMVFKLSGVSFDSADDTQWNNWHNSLCNTLRGNGFYDPRVTIWTHIVRRTDNEYPEGEYPEGFSRDFNERYRGRVVSELLMVNELYLTVVFRPIVSKVGRSLFKTIDDDKQRLADKKAALEFMDQRAIEIEASFRRYDPERLGTYEYNGHIFSEVLEFFAYLVNGEYARMPVRRQRAGDYMAMVRPSFGTETIEVRHPVITYRGAILGYQTYPDESAVGCLNALLSAPFEFTLTQSFSYMTKASAKFVVKNGRRQMKNTDDDAKSQIAALDDLLELLESNKVAFGHHHINLFVKAYSAEVLEKNIADALAIMGDNGCVVAREDLACESAFWAMLPGNFKYRPRLSPITTRNFAALSPFHNYPSGRKAGNHWGEAVTMLLSDANTPYHFSFHASDPEDPDGGTKKDVGHTLILGPTGSGKTVFVTAMQAFLDKFGASYVSFTKDNDQELMIRALGGKFRPLKTGYPTGFNPFQLEPSKKNILFWNKLVKSLVTRPLVLKDEREIEEALQWLAGLNREDRRLGKLLDYLDKGTQDSVYYYLRKWCYARAPGEEDGLYAWVLDNPEDEIAALLDGKQDVVRVGFDVTEFLDEPTVRTPTNMYLFHLVDYLVDGRRMAIWIAEFWKALGDAAFESFAKDQLKTIRKKNGFVVLDSQSPEDALNHPIAPTLIGQTATKILFPHAEAKRDAYINGLSLSEREYRLIKEELGEGSRRFLIKQSGNTVVAKLDLKGFNDELKVLSAKPHTIELARSLIEEHGDEPAKWLPYFMEKRSST